MSEKIPRREEGLIEEDLKYQLEKRRDAVLARIATLREDVKSKKFDQNLVKTEMNVIDTVFQNARTIATIELCEDLMSRLEKVERERER